MVSEALLWFLFTCVHEARDWQLAAQRLGARGEDKLLMSYIAMEKGIGVMLQVHALASIRASDSVCNTADRFVKRQSAFGHTSSFQLSYHSHPLFLARCFLTTSPFHASHQHTVDCYP
jgi:hypothetical protein